MKKRMQIVSIFLLFSIILTACFFNKSKENEKRNESSNLTSSQELLGDDASTMPTSSDESATQLHLESDSKNLAAVDVVKRHLTAKKNNDFNSWKSTFIIPYTDDQSFEKKGDLGVVSLEIKEIRLDNDETKRIRERFTDSELAQSNGWDKQFINDNMIAALSSYFVDYDNTKVPYDEGNITQFFYLIKKDKNSNWLIWDQGKISTN